MVQKQKKKSLVPNSDTVIVMPIKKLLHLALSEWILFNHPIELDRSLLTKPKRVIFLTNLLIAEIKAISVNHEQPFANLSKTIINHIIQRFLCHLNTITEPITVICLSTFLFNIDSSVVDILNETVDLTKYKEPIIKQKKTYSRNQYKKTLYIKHKTSPKKIVRMSLSSLERALKKNHIKIIHYGLIFINLKRTNLFITLSTLRYQVRSVLSAGMASFKGRHKSSTFARDSIGKLISQYAVRQNVRLVDIWFMTTISKLYRPIVLGLVSNLIVVRVLKMRYRRSHGYVRSCKKRRI